MKAKPVKINLSSQVADMMATLRGETPKAWYSFLKNHGGRRKYEVLEQQMLDDALEQQKDQFTDIDYYISPVGNRWMTYTHVVYYPRAQYAQAYHYSFIYYETFRSCGAFFPIYSPVKTYSRKGRLKKDEQIRGVVLYTDHFFFQMSERLKVEYRSKELIRKFVSERCEHALTSDEDKEVVVKFKGGHGFGFEWEHDPQFVQVRTFLRDEELTNKQRRKCEPVDALAQLGKDGTFNPDVALATALNSDLPIEEMAAMASANLEAAKKIGLDGLLILDSQLSVMFARMIADLSHLKLSYQQMVVLQMKTHEARFPFVHKYQDWQNHSYDNDEQFKSDLIDCMLACAKEMKFQYVTRDRVAQWIEKKIKK